MPTFFPTVIILTDQADIGIFRDLLSPKLNSIVDENDFNLGLLYRNSRDGNSAESFHQHCDGHTNTLTLVESNYGHIFGGFTSKDWAMSHYVQDDLAFLFRVKSKFNHPPAIFNNKIKDDSALWMSPLYAPY